MKKPRYLTAAEAAAELGITAATLYAYVSRGMIRSESLGGDQRARRYSTDDVHKLKARKESRRNPDTVAEAALHLGTPILESAITLIHDGRLYYRGHDAITLAENSTIERVAALIWNSNVNEVATWFAAPPQIPPTFESIRADLAHLTPFERFQIILPLAAPTDHAAYDLRPNSVAATGTRILSLMAATIAERDHTAPELASMLAEVWAAHDGNATRLINAALILCADHELNISAFTARCVASSGATPYAVILAGLCALSGSKHGGHTQRVEAFLREADTPEGVYETMAGRLRRGDSIPGFGHMLYPDGDPRAAALLRLVVEAYPSSRASAFAEAGIESANNLLNDHPTIDFALVILAHALGLPRGAVLALFGIGRTIGWVGHAIEQYQLDHLIRPRARYTGHQPPPI